MTFDFNTWTPSNNVWQDFEKTNIVENEGWYTGDTMATTVAWKLVKHKTLSHFTNLVKYESNWSMSLWNFDFKTYTPWQKKKTHCEWAKQHYSLALCMASSDSLKVQMLPVHTDKDELYCDQKLIIINNVHTKNSYKNFDYTVNIQLMVNLDIK